MKALVSEAQFLWTSELENLISTCFKSLEGSNYEVRCCVAKLLGNLLSTAHSPKPQTGRLAGVQTGTAAAGPKPLALEDAMNLLASGFLRGGSGFLRSSTGLAANLPREIRTGVALVRKGNAADQTGGLD